MFKLVNLKMHQENYTEVSFAVVGFVFGESLQQLLKCARVVRPKALLVNVDKVIEDIALDFVDIFAPLGESLHFWCHIRVFSAFCFGDDYTAIFKPNYKIRVVVGDITVGFDIIKLEIYGEVVLGVGQDIGTVFQKSGEVAFKLISHR